MPVSDPTDDPGVEPLVEELAALESAVERLLESHRDLRARAEEMERERRSLEGALSDAQLDALDPETVEDRLRELAEENRVLREKVEEGRERAERIRSRLVVMEDEV